MSKTDNTVVLTETEIDDLAIEQADDDNAWEASTPVEREPMTLTLPPDIATRAAFFAQLHDAASLDDWLVSIIEERLLYEQAIFARVKRAVATRTNTSKAA